MVNITLVIWEFVIKDNYYLAWFNALDDNETLKINKKYNISNNNKKKSLFIKTYTSEYLCTITNKQAFKSLSHTVSTGNLNAF